MFDSFKNMASRSIKELPEDIKELPEDIEISTLHEIEKASREYLEKLAVLKSKLELVFSTTRHMVSPANRVAYNTIMETIEAKEEYARSLRTFEAINNLNNNLPALQAMVSTIIDNLRTDKEIRLKYPQEKTEQTPSDLDQQKSAYKDKINALLQNIETLKDRVSEDDYNRANGELDYYMASIDKLDNLSLAKKTDAELKINNYLNFLETIAYAGIINNLTGAEEQYLSKVDDNIDRLQKLPGYEAKSLIRKLLRRKKRILAKGKKLKPIYLDELNNEIEPKIVKLENSIGVYANRRQEMQDDNDLTQNT